MSYDLEIDFSHAEFPDPEWQEILSWFHAIARTKPSSSCDRRFQAGNEWWIQVGGYGIFCTVRELHTPDRFQNEKIYWRVSIDTGSGFGLRQWFGYALCYWVLSCIPGTRAWDLGQYFHAPYLDPEKFLRKVNAVIANHSSLANPEQRQAWQQLGVLNEQGQLIADPDVLQRTARHEFFNE